MLRKKVMELKSVLMALCFALMSLTAAAQVTVSGTVYETTGDPVIGATVMEKGIASNGTITDIDGKFFLMQ